MRFSSLSGHDNVCAVLGRLEGNGLADASAGAGDEQRLAGEFPAEKISESFE
jgi:hypothetical protein